MLKYQLTPEKETKNKNKNQKQNKTKQKLWFSLTCKELLTAWNLSFQGFFGEKRRKEIKLKVFNCLLWTSLIIASE